MTSDGVNDSITLGIYPVALPDGPR